LHAAAKPAKTRTTSKAKKVTTKLSCSLALVTQVPTNDVTVTQGAETGKQYGAAGCAGAGGSHLSGVERASFGMDAAGVLAGPYQQWFNAGSVYGTYTLTPVDSTSPPTTTSFTAETYKGTITAKGGTGSFSKATGSGTLSCTTSDAAHLSCQESLRLTQAVVVTTTTKPARKG
jgi:hypothetical protein